MHFTLKQKWRREIIRLILSATPADRGAGDTTCTLSILALWPFSNQTSGSRRKSDLYRNHRFHTLSVFHSLIQIPSIMKILELNVSKAPEIFVLATIFNQLAKVREQITTQCSIGCYWRRTTHGKDNDDQRKSTIEQNQLDPMVLIKCNLHKKVI